jgi:O-antigen/teichoic acid export membrane protein
LRKKIHLILREDNFLSLAGNLTTAVFGVGGFALLARTYPPEAFGKWVLFLSLGSLVEMFRFGITSAAIVRFLSGTSEHKRIHYIGSNGLISLAATCLSALLIAAMALVFRDSIQNSAYAIFFTWYPLLVFANLPWNNALVILQSERRYGRILLLRSINAAGFFLIITANYLKPFFTLQLLAPAMIFVNLITSIISLAAGWDGFRHLSKSTMETSRQLLDFGKFSTVTMLGSNLLRNADAFIISFSPMGPAAVALYSIPLKLTELLQIPLRSFTATAFPKMSKASMDGDRSTLRDLFYTYSGAMTLLFFFICIFTFIFAAPLVMLLGGSQYRTSDPHTGANAAMLLKIFSVYGILLPVERMTGIGLDSINQPGKNARKVAYMLLANIVGDIIAVFAFHSLTMVACSSLLFTMLGIWIGFMYLHKEISLDSRQILRHGMDFFRDGWYKIFKTATP